MEVNLIIIFFWMSLHPPSMSTIHPWILFEHYSCRHPSSINGWIKCYQPAFLSALSLLSLRFGATHPLALAHSTRDTAGHPDFLSCKISNHHKLQTPAGQIATMGKKFRVSFVEEPADSIESNCQVLMIYSSYTGKRTSWRRWWTRRRR